MQTLLRVGVPCTLLLLSAACTQSEQTRTQRDAERAGDKVEAGANRAADATKDAAKDTGQAVSEAGLTGKVKSRLAADVRLSTLTSINVDSNGSTVTLTGRVPNAEDKRSAERVATATDGVAKVVNNLEVAP